MNKIYKATSESDFLLLTTKYGRTFRPNKRISETRLCKWFNLAIPKSTGNRYLDSREYNNFNLRKAGVYTKINRFLARQGLYLKQEESGAWYRVLKDYEVPSQIGRYRRTAIKARECRDNLLQGHQYRLSL